MAVSRGQESIEGIVRKLYIGVGSSYLKGVNPSKEELEKLYGRTQDKEPEYLSTVESDGKEIPQIKLDFIMKPDPEKYLDIQGSPIDVLIHVPIFLRRKYKQGSTSGKYQIMDKYGRTAWATREDIENKRIPVYNTKDGGTMQANISPDYFVAYEGMEDLTQLIRAFLNIPVVEKWEDGKVVGLIDDPSKAEVVPDHIEDWFKGDFREIKEIFGYQPNNKVKVCYGVRTTQDNKQYQAAYTRKFLKNNVNDYSKLDKDIAEAKKNGSFANTEFDCNEFREYQVKPSTFSPTGIAMPEGFMGAPTPW